VLEQLVGRAQEGLSTRGALLNLWHATVHEIGLLWYIPSAYLFLRPLDECIVLRQLLWQLRQGEGRKHGQQRVESSNENATTNC